MVICAYNVGYVYDPVTKCQDLHTYIVKYTYREIVYIILYKYM